ncbi:hypothetical protein IT570_14250 [Candidatus Sumerlaeota bacterium]|nr:hypothetical protein [Candidatus Sumerlaeota bacterium]
MRTVKSIRRILFFAIVAFAAAVAGAQQPTLLPTSTPVWTPLPRAASSRTPIPPPELDGTLHLTKAWDRPLSDTLSQAQAFCVVNLHQYLATNSNAGPKLFALRMKENGSDDPALAIPLEGLPAQFTVSAIGANPMLDQFFIAGALNGAPAIFQGEAGEGVAFTNWKQLPPFPETTPPQFLSIHDEGEFTYFITATGPGDKATITGGWAANTGAGKEQFLWRKIPAPKFPRPGSSAFVVAGSVIQAGGAQDERTFESTPPMERIAFDKKNFGAWQPMYIPVPRTISESVAASEGRTMYLAARMLPKSDSHNEQPRVYYSNTIDTINFTTWNPMFLPDSGAPLRAMTVDPAHNLLLLVYEAHDGGDPLISAYKLPPNFSAHRKSSEEMKLAMEERVALQPKRISVADALEKAREKDTAVVVVITSGEKTEDVETRVQMRSNQFNYMMRGTQITYLTGADGAKVLSDYGVSGTPAYLLLDKDGKLIGKFTGRIPNREEMFELTKPLRLQPEEPASAETAAPQ